MTAFVFLLDEIRWQIFHRIHEEDKKLDSHLRAAPKITASIIIYQPLSTMEVVSRVPSGLNNIRPNNLCCNGTILP